jgi:hypothetical protein
MTMPIGATTTAAAAQSYSSYVPSTAATDLSTLQAPPASPDYLTREKCKPCDGTRLIEGMNPCHRCNLASITIDRFARKRFSESCFATPPISQTGNPSSSTTLDQDTFTITDLKMDTTPIRPATLTAPDYEAEILESLTLEIDCSEKEIARLQGLIDAGNRTKHFYRTRVDLRQLEALTRTNMFEFNLKFIKVILSPKPMDCRFGILLGAFYSLEKLVYWLADYRSNANEDQLAHTYYDALRKTIETIRTGGPDDVFIHLGQLRKHMILLSKALATVAKPLEKQCEAAIEALTSDKK